MSDDLRKKLSARRECMRNARGVGMKPQMQKASRFIDPEEFNDNKDVIASMSKNGNKGKGKQKLKQTLANIMQTIPEDQRANACADMATKAQSVNPNGMQMMQDLLQPSKHVTPANVVPQPSIPPKIYIPRDLRGDGDDLESKVINEPSLPKDASLPKKKSFAKIDINVPKLQEWNQLGKEEPSIPLKPILIELFRFDPVVARLSLEQAILESTKLCKILTLIPLRNAVVPDGILPILQWLKHYEGKTIDLNWIETHFPHWNIEVVIKNQIVTLCYGDQSLVLMKISD